MMTNMILKDFFRKIPLRYRLPIAYKNIINLNNCGKCWSADDIRHWQLIQLKALVEYAYKYVPGYYHLYHDAGINNFNFFSFSDFKQLPCVTKEIIRDNLKDFTSRKFGKREIIYQTTGGSTGIPFGFYVTNDNYWIEGAFVSVEWGKVGWNLHDNGIMMRGGYVGDDDHIIKKVSNDSIYLPNKGYLLSPYYIKDEYYPIYRQVILNSHSDYLFSYPSSAALLAKLIIQNGDAGIFNLKMFFLGSENCYPWQIDLIKKAFPKTILHSCYGQTEKVIIASWERNNEKYGVNPFYGYTEFIGKDGKESIEGKLCELVGTSFWMKATPFIRYRTSDFGVKGCGNGTSLYTIDKIDGRLNEVVITKSGRKISMVSINMHDSTFDDVAQFRFVQEMQGKLTLLVIPRPNVELHVERIKMSLGLKLGNDMDISVVPVRELLPSKTGKFSFLEQKIKLNDADRLDY